MNPIKLLAAVLVFGLLTTPSFSESSPTDSGNARIWATAISKNEAADRQILFRYIHEFEPGFERAAYPHRIVITWDYEAQNGMPDHAELESMYRLEDLLKPVAEDSGLAVLTMVSTGEGLREWTYYARSEEAFFKALNAVLASEARFPIEIHAAEDLPWKTYQDFRSGVYEKP